MAAFLLLLSEQSTHLTRAAVIAVLALGFVIAGLHPALRTLSDESGESPLTRGEQRIFLVLGVLLFALSIRELVIGWKL
jgi:uncharacterized membrane protein YidH (DUF202 family)